MTKSKDKKKYKKPKRSKKALLVNIVVIIIAFFTLRVATLFLLIGMLPTMGASTLDRTPERNSYKIVMACNFAGVLPYLVKLWQNGISFSSMYEVLLDMQVVAVMWGAAAFGWLLVWFFPRAVQFILDMVQSSQVVTLRRRQQQIVDEWGLQVEVAARKHLKNTAYEDGARAAKSKKKEGVDHP